MFNYKRYCNINTNTKGPHIVLLINKVTYGLYASVTERPYPHVHPSKTLCHVLSVNMSP